MKAKKRRLTYKEAIPAIEEFRLKVLKERKAQMKSKKSTKKSPGVPLAKIQKKEKSRTKLAKQRDLAKNNSTVVKPSSPRVKTWMKDPGSMDVKGVDTANKKEGKSKSQKPGCQEAQKDKEAKEIATAQFDK